MKTQQLRQHYRQIRRRLSSTTQSLNASLLSQKISESPGFTGQLKIAAYIAVQGEISLDVWISENSQHNIYLPKLVNSETPLLRFAELTDNTQWEKNRFNIAEPDIPWEESLQAHELDIILLPLVAFDREGNRLGMGGGYYDRSLAFKNSDPKKLKPRLIGVAHSCQEHKHLTRQSWDVPLDLIITEKEVITTVQS